MNEINYYPYLAVNGKFLDKKFLDDIWEELESKANLGLEPFNKAEKLAYVVLNQITLRRTS